MGPTDSSPMYLREMKVYMYTYICAIHKNLN